jgi:hypothetical protein
MPPQNLFPSPSGIRYVVFAHFGQLAQWNQSIEQYGPALAQSVNVHSLSGARPTNLLQVPGSTPLVDVLFDAVTVLG